MKKPEEVWSIGDIAWFIPYGEKRPQQGEIVTIIDTVDIPCATLIMAIDMKYRTAMISMLCETSKEAKAQSES